MGSEVVDEVGADEEDSISVKVLEGVVVVLVVVYRAFRVLLDVVGPLLDVDGVGLMVVRYHSSLLTDIFSIHTHILTYALRAHS